MTKPDQRALPPIKVRTQSAGQELTVYVHPAEVGGRIVCVGLDLRTDDQQPVTTATVRGLRTAEIIESAFTKGRNLLKLLLEDAPPEQKVTPELLAAAFGATAAVGYSGDPPLNKLRPQLAGQVDEFFEPAESPKRRGPRPLLDDSALGRVVAAAYVSAQSKPVQRVREALQESGLLGAIVTIEQARKAVASARARGFIPPASRSRSPLEDEA